MHMRNLVSLAEKNVKDDQVIMYKYVIQELNTCRKDLGFAGNVDTVFNPRNIKEIYAYMISSVDKNLVPIYREIIEAIAQWLKKDINLTGITAVEDLITFDEDDNEHEELVEEEDADDENSSNEEETENDNEDEDDDEDDEDDDEDEDDEDDEDEDDDDDDDDEDEDDDDSTVDPFMFLKMISTVKETLEVHNELINEQNKLFAKYIAYFKYALIANCLIGSAAIGVMGTLIYKKL